MSTFLPAAFAVAGSYPTFSPAFHHRAPLADRLPVVLFAEEQLLPLEPANEPGPADVRRDQNYRSVFTVTPFLDALRNTLMLSIRRHVHSVLVWVGYCVAAQLAAQRDVGWPGCC